MFKAFYGQSVRQSEFWKVLSKSSVSMYMYKNCRVLWVNNYTCLRTSILKLLV
jgi:hypothetical protein